MRIRGGGVRAHAGAQGRHGVSKKSRSDGTQRFKMSTPGGSEVESGRAAGPICARGWLAAPHWGQGHPWEARFHRSRCHGRCRLLQSLLRGPSGTRAPCPRALGVGCPPAPSSRHQASLDVDHIAVVLQREAARTLSVPGSQQWGVQATSRPRSGSQGGPWRAGPAKTLNPRHAAGAG